VGCAFDRDDVREPHDAGLGGGVVGGSRLPEESGGRRDEDEPAVALRFHHPERGLAQVEAAVEVDAEHPPPVRGGQLVEARGVEDPRVADDRVETTEPVDRGADDRRSAFRAGHGVVRRHRDAARAVDLLDDLVGDTAVRALAVHRASEVVHHHRCTAPGDLHRVQAAETSTCSGDDRDLAGEVDHVPAAHWTPRGCSQDMSLPSWAEARPK
jgi:hypothetical protein